MILTIEGKPFEFEPDLWTELYEKIEKIIIDPKYKKEYSISFSEFSTSSGKQNFFPIEADMLMDLIKCKSQMDKPVTAEQCEKLLAVKKNQFDSFSFNSIIGAMVFYGNPNNT